MPTITVSEETYRRVIARAAALDVSIEEAIAAEPKPPPRASGTSWTASPRSEGEREMTPKERLQLFEEMTKRMAEHTRTLPPGFQVDIDRGSIYQERCCNKTQEHSRPKTNKPLES